VLSVDQEICYHGAKAFKNISCITLADFDYALGARFKESQQSPELMVECIMDLLETFVEHSVQLKEVYIAYIFPYTRLKTNDNRLMVLNHAKGKQWSNMIRIHVNGCNRWKRVIIISIGNKF